jgi:hypothetical protein
MTDTTRRAFIAATTSLAALSAPALALSAPRHDPGLVRCIGAHRRASQIVEGWHETVFNPARTSHLQARADVPHYTTEASYESNGGGRLHMSTDTGTHVAIATSILRDGEHDKDDDFLRCCKELRQALDQRNARLQQIDDDWQDTKLSERSNRLCDKRFELFSAVCAYPVRTVADLVLKLETMQEHDGDDQPIDNLLADLKRIEGRA